MNRPSNLSRAEQACNELAASGQPVTFTAVAEQAGIGRATLYRDTAIRAVIDDHRRQAASANTLSGLAADIAALHTALEAVAARVRNHEEQLRKLRRSGTTAAPPR
jgi:hypothetical protein